VFINASSFSIPIEVDLGPDIEICDGDVATLDAGNPGYNFLWSTGETTQTIDVSAAGTYWVEVSYLGNSESDTIEVTVNDLPVINDVTLQASVLSPGPPWNWPVGGDFAGGFDMCIDPFLGDGNYYYLDVNTFSLTSGLDLQMNYLNGFKVNTGFLPADWWTYWDAKGVNAGATYPDWQAYMWQIINGNQPIFYIMYDGTDFRLVDGLLYQLSGGTLLSDLRVNGDYPECNYHYDGTVVDENGCESLLSTVMMQFNHVPVANAGPDVLIYIGYPPESTQLNATGGVQYSWYPTTGLSDPNIADPIAQPPVTTTYTVTVTDANGCSDTDDVTVEVLDVRCGKKMDKVLVCHIPPGNPENAHTICIAPAAVPAHLAHGDYLGPCTDDKSAPVVEIMDELSVSAYPVPFEDQCRIDLSSQSDAYTIIRITDMLGREVEKVYEGKLSAGEHHFIWSNAGDGNSVYILQVFSNGNVKTLKLLTE